MLALARRCALALSMVLSSQALANTSYDTVVMQTGRRWFYGSSHFLADEFGGTVFYKVSDLSLAMGGGLSFFNIRKEGLYLFDHPVYVELDHPVAVEAAWGYEVSLEAKLWLPKTVLALPFTPYLIYAHDLFSDYEIKGQSPFGGTKSKASTNGYKFNLGVDVPVTQSLTMNVEYSMGSQRIKHKYSRSFSTDIEEQDGVMQKEGSVVGSLESRAFLLGLGMKV